MLVRSASQTHDAGMSLLATGVGLSMLAVLAVPIDLPVAQWLGAHELPAAFRRLLRLSEVFAWGVTVTVIVLAAALLDARGWRIVPRLAAVTVGGGLAADTVKLLVARLRPSAADLDGGTLETFVAWLPALDPVLLGQSYGYTLQSFPSGHAATAAGLAVALALLYPRGRWLFGAVAALAAAQRLQGHAHFVSDVLAGASLGALAGAACTLPGPLARAFANVESGRGLSRTRPAGGPRSLRPPTDRGTIAT